MTLAAHQNPTGSHRPVSDGSMVGTILISLFIGVISLRFLAIEWAVSPQYSFGWGVPLLAAYLFWKRCHDCPAPAPIEKTKALAIGAILLAVFLPVRLMLEANPDWRILLWMNALVLLGSFLLMIWFIGGQPWLKQQPA